MSVMLLANTMKSFIYKENVDTANYRNLAMIVQKMLFNTAESNNKYIYSKLLVRSFCFFHKHSSYVSFFTFRKFVTFYSVPLFCIISQYCQVSPRI